MFALFVLIVGLATPGAVLGREHQIKLALLPVGQPGSFFDLTMEPGTTRSFDVDLANDGDAAIAVRTYVADVYTIINGGFGARLRGQVQTGITAWIDYPTEVVRLPSGKASRRSFSVTIPAEAGPGEYITSLVLENDLPILDVDAIGLNQVVRQAVAVVVTVPGRRSPGLAIGAATHQTVAGISIVRVAVQNTGNVRDKPMVGFELVDWTGARISHATIQMGSFYAHTETYVEFPLARLLLPGTYAVRLTLDDADQAVRADRSDIALVVEAPATVPIDGAVAPGGIEVLQGAGGVPMAAVGIVVLAGILFAVLLASVLILRRRHRRIAQRRVT